MFDARVFRVGINSNGDFSFMFVLSLDGRSFVPCASKRIHTFYIYLDMRNRMIEEQTEIKSSI